MRVGVGRVVVRQSRKKVRLTTKFLSIYGRTLGSPSGRAVERSETERGGSPARGGTNSDRVQWTKQGAVSGCVSEALPAAETAELEQGRPSKFASAPRARRQFR